LSIISVFFTRPLSSTLFILSIALLFWAMLKNHLKRRRAAANGAKA
jgi:TctA family transporter